MKTYRRNTRSGRYYISLRKLLLLLLVYFVFAVIAPSVRAEVRTYSQVNTHLFNISRTSSISIFLKQESRFRESGLVLNKVSVGLKPKILPWLSSQLYYANKDMDYTHHLNKHMLVGDITMSTRFGAFVIKDRSGNEWHITDRFYRYRNYFEVAWRSPVRQLILYSSEEWRYDSDQTRINMNDVRLGMTIDLQKGCNARLFFDFESNRRNTDSWLEKPFLGMELTAAL